MMLSSKSLSNFIRIRTAELTQRTNSSHIGSVYSCADIISCIYSRHCIDSKPLSSTDCPTIILSKGHACLAIYTALEYLSLLDDLDLDTYASTHTIFMSHISHKVPNVQFSTGALGHGLGLAIGMSIGATANNINNPIYVVLGDGELQEGSIWEALMYIGAKRVRNIIPIVDFNNQQSFGSVSETLSLDPLYDKIKSFGLEPVQCNGHDHNDLAEALTESSTYDLKPPFIIAKTIKGFPIDFMMDNHLWHYKSPNESQLISIKKQLSH